MRFVCARNSRLPLCIRMYQKRPHVHPYYGPTIINVKGPSPPHLLPHLSQLDLPLDGSEALVLKVQVCGLVLFGCSCCGVDPLGQTAHVQTKLICLGPWVVESVPETPRMANTNDRAPSLSSTLCQSSYLKVELKWARRVQDSLAQLLHMLSKCQACVGMKTGTFKDHSCEELSFLLEIKNP